MIANSSSSSKSPTNSPANEGAARWAAEQLGIAPGSSEEDCTKAFLRQLDEEDFVPPMLLRKAWEYSARSSDREISLPPWIEAEVEEELSGRIEKFAAQFFKLPTAERSRQWMALFAEAARWPRLEMRLRQLKAGLTVEIPPLSNLGPREVLLIQWIRELFPLPPDRRAVRRRELLKTGVLDEMRFWEQAARSVEGQQPALAALGQDLLSPMANWSGNSKEAKETRQWRSCAPQYAPYKRLDAPGINRTPPLPNVAPQQAKRRVAKRAWLGLPIFAWWAILFCVVSVVAPLINDKGSPNTGYVPRWARPDYLERSFDESKSSKEIEQGQTDGQGQQPSAQHDAEVRRGAELAYKWLEIRRKFPNDDAGARKAMEQFVEETSPQPSSPADTASLRKAGQLVSKKLLEQNSPQAAPPAAPSPTPAAPQSPAPNSPAAPKNSAGPAP